MKIATLTVMTASNKLVCAGVGDSLSPLLEQAKEIQSSGKHDGEAVVSGEINANWQPFAYKRFRVVQPEKKPKK